MNSKILIVLVLALLACGASALRMRSVINNNNNVINDVVITDYAIKGTPFNGSLSLGTLIPNKWNQTSFALSTTITNVPLTTMWIYFSDSSTGQPIPSSYFQRASLTLSTSNGGLSVYNALTSSLGVARVFAASDAFVIPQGNLTLKVTYSLASSVPPLNASVSWEFVQGVANTNTVEHANVFLPSWNASGVYSGSVTTAIPYDGFISYAVGNVLVGGQSVTLVNTATQAVLCTSSVTPSGDLSPCSLNVQITKGTKISVTVKSNSTGVVNNGGMDLYIVKVVPVTTTTTAAASTSGATHATAATAATAGHATTGASATHSASSSSSSTHAASSASHSASTSANSAGHAASSNNNGGNNGGNSGHTSSNNGGNSGHSGSGNGGNSGGNSGGDSGKTTSSSSSGNGNGNSAANGGVTMGYSSGSSGSSGSSSGGTGGFFEGEKAIFQMKQKPTKEIKAKSAKKSPKEVTLNDLKKKAMNNMNDEIEETESEDHFRVFEEKSSQKFF